jgi:hypothetical protein
LLRARGSTCSAHRLLHLARPVTGIAGVGFGAAGARRHRRGRARGDEKQPSATKWTNAPLSL